MNKETALNLYVGAASAETLRRLEIDQTAFGEVTRDFIRCGELWTSMRENIADRIKITGPQYSILSAATNDEWPEGLTVNEIARMIGVSGPFVTRESGKLIDRQLLKKSRNQLDGRSVLLAPTEAGKAAIRDARRRLQAVNAEMFRQFDVERFKQFGEIIKDIRATSEHAVLLSADEI